MIYLYLVEILRKVLPENDLIIAAYIIPRWNIPKNTSGKLLELFWFLLWPGVCECTYFDLRCYKPQHIYYNLNLCMPHWENCQCYLRGFGVIHINKTIWNSFKWYSGKIQLGDLFIFCKIFPENYLVFFLECSYLVEVFPRKLPEKSLIVSRFLLWPEVLWWNNKIMIQIYYLYPVIFFLAASIQHNHRL